MSQSSNSSKNLNIFGCVMFFIVLWGIYNIFHGKMDAALSLLAPAGMCIICTFLFPVDRLFTDTTDTEFIFLPDDCIELVEKDKNSTYFLTNFLDRIWIQYKFSTQFRTFGIEVPLTAVPVVLVVPVNSVKIVDEREDIAGVLTDLTGFITVRCV